MTLNQFSEAELALISQIKRFMEWLQGDPFFKNEVETKNFSHATMDRMRKIGITFKLDDVAMIWENPVEFNSFFSNMAGHGINEMPNDIPISFDDYPILKLWARYSLTRNRIGRGVNGQAIEMPKNRKFNEWRNRRILSARSELGFFGYTIDHPILAFELGDGCSVGCWFCAFATQKLKKNFDYPENREFFRSVVKHCVDIFGKRAAGMALLYYGTEPHDNPHYIDFIKDHAEITGSPSCTSTAIIHDVKWIRELIAYYRQYALPWPRLSVLSKGMLHKIHDLYTPHELRDVTLLMQMMENERPKVSGGRIFDEHKGLRGRAPDKYLEDIVPQGSISCVSGFLINMVNQSIKLVSPCYTSSQWPYGYRVFDEDKFQGTGDFRDVVEKMIERNMSGSPLLHIPLKFRDDLLFKATEQGFDLISPNQVHHFKGKDVYGPIGGMIAQGDMTCSEIYDNAEDEHGINLMIAMAVIKTLFDNGFLNELCVYNSPGRKPTTNDEY